MGVRVRFAFSFAASHNSSDIFMDLGFFFSICRVYTGTTVLANRGGSFDSQAAGFGGRLGVVELR